LHRQGRGLPRLVNVIADRAMLAAFASDRHEIKPAIVRAAAAEVAGTAPRTRRWIWLAIVATALAIAGTALVWLR